MQNHPQIFKNMAVKILIWLQPLLRIFCAFWNAFLTIWSVVCIPRTLYLFYALIFSPQALHLSRFGGVDSRHSLLIDACLWHTSSDTHFANRLSCGRPSFGIRFAAFQAWILCKLLRCRLAHARSLFDAYALVSDVWYIVGLMAMSHATSKPPQRLQSVGHE